MAFQPDIVYAHFLYRGGAAALRIAERRSIPAVVALGEAAFEDYERDLGINRIRRDLAMFDGVVAVADWIRDLCIDRYRLASDRIVVEPNGINTMRFQRIDRNEVRERLELPINRPLVAFVGHFIDRKGPLRVLDAISRDPEIGAVFIGDGPQVPTGEQVLFAGRVEHASISDWLSAADLFVLPTLAEGSCNAILEAMACGCAIISSNIPAIQQLTGSDAALLIDPSSTSDIAEAITELLRDSKARETLGSRALVRSREFSLDQRARRLLTWLETIADPERAGCAGSAT